MDPFCSEPATSAVNWCLDTARSAQFWRCLATTGDGRQREHRRRTEGPSGAHTTCVPTVGCRMSDRRNPLGPMTAAPVALTDVLDPSRPAGDAVVVSIARHLLIIGAAVILWLWGATHVDESQMNDFGLISVLPWSVLASYLIMLIGYASVVKIDYSGRIQGIYVTSFTVMLHGIPAFAYEHLRFSWAWKHVGIVDYIQRFGDVDLTIEKLPAYHNWPGFFGLNAWITESSQLDSALSYASWAPVLFNLLFLLALYVMFRGFTHDMRLVWTSILVFMLGNWVGQDYFAPQALAFFLYLMVMAILLRWFARNPGTDVPTDPREPTNDAIQPGTVPYYALSGVVALGLFVIAVSHQLTPIITIAALGALVTFRVIRVSWPLYAMLAFTAAWFLGPARGFVVDNLQTVMRDVGGFQANIDQNLIDYEIVNRTQQLVSLIARLLSATIFGLAGLGWLRRRYHGVRTGWAALLAAVPAVLVVVSSYGGEVIFRAYLFALPFAAFLAASLWFPQERTGTRAVARSTLAVVLVVLTGALLIADFGADRRQVFTDGEVAAADYVFAESEPGALIIEGTRDYPRQYRNYELYTFLALDRLTNDSLERLRADPAARIAGWLSDDDQYNGGFVIITESQRNTASVLGTLLVPTLDAIENSLLASDQFDLVFENEDARVFAPVGQE